MLAGAVKPCGPGHTCSTVNILLWEMDVFKKQATVEENERQVDYPEIYVKYCGDAQE